MIEPIIGICATVIIFLGGCALGTLVGKFLVTCIEFVENFFRGDEDEN